MKATFVEKTPMPSSSACPRTGLRSGRLFAAPAIAAALCARFCVASDLTSFGSESSLELYLPWLDAQWTAGERNATALWRRLKAGIPWLLACGHRVGHASPALDQVNGDALRRAPSARTIARLMTIGRDSLSKPETVTVAVIEGGVPSLVEAREIVAGFQAMIRKKLLPISNLGWSGPDQVWSPRSPTAFSKIARPSALRSRRNGPTVRPRPDHQA